MKRSFDRHFSNFWGDALEVTRGSTSCKRLLGSFRLRRQGKPVLCRASFCIIRRHFCAIMLRMSTLDLPQEVKACLWSYNTDQIDLHNQDHRRRVIENILNRGTQPAVDWLFTHTSSEEIKQVILESTQSVWSKKSLALWSLVFAVTPSRASRF